MPARASFKSRRILRLDFRLPNQFCSLIPSIYSKQDFHFLIASAVNLARGKLASKSPLFARQ